MGRSWLLCRLDGREGKRARAERPEAQLGSRRPLWTSLLSHLLLSEFPPLPPDGRVLDGRAELSCTLRGA